MDRGRIAILTTVLVGYASAAAAQTSEPIENEAVRASAPLRPADEEPHKSQVGSPISDVGSRDDTKAVRDVRPAAKDGQGHTSSARSNVPANVPPSTRADAGAALWLVGAAIVAALIIVGIFGRLGRPHIMSLLERMNEQLVAIKEGLPPVSQSKPPLITECKISGDALVISGAHFTARARVERAGETLAIQSAAFNSLRTSAPTVSGEHLLVVETEGGSAATELPVDKDLSVTPPSNRAMSLDTWYEVSGGGFRSPAVWVDEQPCISKVYSSTLLLFKTPEKGGGKQTVTIAQESAVEKFWVMMS